MTNRNIIFGRAHSLIFFVASVSIILLLAAQPATATPIVPDANSVIFDALDGSSSGTPYGVTYATSQAGYGQAGQFGSSKYIKYYLPNPGYWGTIEMWIYPQSLASGETTGLLDLNWYNRSSHSQDGHIGYLDITPDGEVNWASWAVGSLRSTSTIPVGQWTHIAFTWGLSVSKLYINGVVEDFVNSNLKPSFLSSNWAYLNDWGGITTGPTPPAVFNGLIDEFHISNVQRTDLEIQQHAAVPEPSTLFLLGVVFLGLLGYTRFKR